MQRGQSCLLMETAGFASKCRTETIFKKANNYLPSNTLNKETKKKAFRTSRTTYHFLQSRVGFLRVIRLQVIDSSVL